MNTATAIVGITHKQQGLICQSYFNAFKNSFGSIMKVLRLKIPVKSINLKFIVFSFSVFLFSQNLLAQTLQVLNIQDATRNNTADKGYVLDGSYMSGSARLKLTNAANFGPSGTVKYTLNITNAYGAPGSLPAIATLNTYDIIFIGYFENANAWTAAELTTLKAWSAQAKKVLIIAEQQFISNPVGISMGFPEGTGTGNPSSQAIGDISTNVKIFSGPFGTVNPISQAGGSQGFFNSTCTAQALARDINGKPTMIYNPTYNDVLIADTDFFTSLQSLMTAGGTITTANEKAWGNLWAWAVREATTGTTPSVSSGGTTSTLLTLPLCGTTNNAFISLSGAVGDIIRWESSIDGGTTWSPIYSSANPLTYSNAANNQQFRAVTSADPTCPALNSTATTITTNSSACAATNTGVGTIDCSKTQISPAPVAGTASQGDLIVSINVTTAGTFTPLSVSGSGFSLANGITSITATSTGIQTFHIPVKYDGTALGTMNFTVGTLTACTADMTKAPKNAISSVWTLDCISTAGPGLK